MSFLAIFKIFHWQSQVVIYEGLYFDLAQGQMNGAPNETDSHKYLWLSVSTFQTLIYICFIIDIVQNL